MATELSGKTQNASSCAGSTESNQSVTFSSCEDKELEAARQAWFEQKRTYERWLVIGRGIRILRRRADRLGGRQTFARLMAEQGFRMDGPKPERQFSKSTVTRLLQVIEREPEVTAWHKGLTPDQQIAWASPDAIIRHCNVFAKPKPPGGETKPSAYEQLKRANIELQEENNQLKQREDGDTWSVKDNDRDIALAMIGQLEPYKGKAERVFREGSAILYERRRKSASKPADQISNSAESSSGGDLSSVLKTLVRYMDDGGMTERALPTILAAEPAFDHLALTDLSKAIKGIADAWKRHAQRGAKAKAA
jgi:hypothetical protein